MNHDEQTDLLEDLKQAINNVLIRHDVGMESLVVIAKTFEDGQPFFILEDSCDAEMTSDGLIIDVAKTIGLSLPDPSYHLYAVDIIGKCREKPDVEIKLADGRDVIVAGAPVYERAPADAALLAQERYGELIGKGDFEVIVFEDERKLHSLKGIASG